ncbi:MAG TPA: hypothetical protein PK954_23505 [Anaerolineales bacterium]|nr:hypothetical protein [Anaerolineales bacterium]HRF49813.1 hypothetical protein [Anaerolineales bacterium]
MQQILRRKSMLGQARETVSRVVEGLKDEIDTMQMDILQSNQVLRAFKQAPWRIQTQTLAWFSILILATLVVGGLYLAVASRAGNAGRDLQYYEQQKTDLVRENDRLRAQLANLRNMDHMAARALALGFVPATPEQVYYIAVDDYPIDPGPAPLPVTVSAPVPATADEAAAAALVARADQGWLTQSLTGLYETVFSSGEGE